MIPLTFMDGAVIYRWNRLVWAAMFGMATFLFWQLVINENSSYVDALRQTSVQFCLLMLTVFTAVTMFTWAYFRHRRPVEAVEASPGRHATTWRELPRVLRLPRGPRGSGSAG